MSIILFNLLTVYSFVLFVFLNIKSVRCDGNRGKERRFDACRNVLTIPNRFCFNLVTTWRKLVKGQQECLLAEVQRECLHAGGSGIDTNANMYGI